MPGSGFFSRFFGGKPRVDLWRRYERMRESVTGTMSHFYKVREISTGRVLGLKIINHEKSDPIEGRYRGLKKPSEGEIGMLFKGPNIAKTLEWGETTTGETYILLEFIEGKLLHTVISAGQPFSPPQRLDLVRKAAAAIAAVHNAGFIHRDICPRNFMLKPDGQLVLFDFGLTVPDKPAFLQPGNRIGTASYMAPEVVRRRPVDRRLDIFAFGVTAFELCALDMPWPRVAGGKAALRHDSTEPREISEFWKDIPKPLATAIMGCISADPERRPQSLEKFLAQIERLEL
ncbi:MAG: serine/threonine-protein kinase [Planctomycetota bacterium]